MKKIVFITNRLAEGGAEKVVATLSNYLAIEHKVHIIILENKIDYNIDSRVNLHILNNSLNKNNLISLLKTTFRLRNSLIKTINKIEESGPIDLLTSHLVISDFLCKISKVKPIYCIHNIYTQHPTFKKKVFQLFFKWLYNNEKLIAISNAVKFDVLKNIRIRPKKINIIPNPIDFKEVLPSKDSRIPTEKYLIHVGRFEPQKRHDILLKAYKDSNTKYPLYLLGEGKNKEKTIKLAKELNIEDKVIFLGWVDNPYSWIYNSECLILSSDSEGLPIVILEAFALNKPVITTDFLGVEDILGYENIKFIAKKGNYKSLSKLIKQGEFSEFQVPSVEKYKVDSVVKEYLKLIDRN